MSNVPLFVSMPRDDIIHTRLLNEVLQGQCFDDPPSPTLYSCYRMCNKHGVGDKVAAATLETPRAAPPWLPPPPRPKRSCSEVFMYQQTRRQMTLVAYKCFLIRKNGMLTPPSWTKPLPVDKFKKEITPRSSNCSFTGENAPSPKLSCIRLVDSSKTARRVD